MTNEELIRELRKYANAINKGSRGLFKVKEAELFSQAADTIEELSKRVPKTPHGRLIDADAFLRRALETKCFRGDYALMLQELVFESTTIIEAEEGET